MQGGVNYNGNTLLSGGINVNTTGNIQALNVQVNENGERTITPPEGVDGYAPITIDTNVPIPEPVLDTLNVTSNGTYTPPSGVDGYDEVNVSVPTPEPVLDTLNVTSNGTYTPPSGVDGYDEVNVSVPTPEPVLDTLNVTSNGTYTPPSGVDGYDEVNVSISGYTIKTPSTTPTPIASFTDGTDNPLKSLTVSIEPQQNLHGYDNPWVGGAGKNKVDGGTLTPSASNTNYSISPTLVKGNYVLSFDVSNLAWTNLNNTSFAWTKDSNNTQKDLLSHSIKRVSDNAYLKNLTQPVTGRFYGVFSNVEVASLVIACRNNTYMNFTSGTITNIQLESGSTPTSYAPYSNICPISGWTEEVITVTDDLQNPTVTHTTTIPFVDGQGQSVEVFGGEIDVTNGVVTPCPYYASYNGEQLTGEWISDRDVYSPNTTPAIGAQVVNIGATGTPLSVQPTSIKSLDGENNVSASTGDVDELKYFADL